MSERATTRLRAAFTAVLIGLAGGGTVSIGAVLIAAPPALAATALLGTFQIAPGSCAGGHVTGSYFRMFQPGGAVALQNTDSSCSDQTYTPMSPGSAGGLITGRYQPPPKPAFDSSGNGVANSITKPTPFYHSHFATATNAVDPQTGKSVPAPSVSANGSTLSADLRSFAANWNGQNFNQGAPKPDGSTPGSTKLATGTYDAASGVYTLQWQSTVVGGSFNNFTGQWHLTGRFIRASGTSNSSGGGSGSHASHAGGSGSGGSANGSNGGGGAAQAPPAPGSGSGGGARQPAPGHASAAATPQAASSAAPAAAANASPVASTQTITKESWHASWWLIGLVIAIAAAGIIALLAINRSLRTGGQS